LVGNRYYHRQSPFSVQQLASRLRISIEACNKVVDALLDAKLLVATDDEVPALLPGYAPETMLLKDIINVVRKRGETRYLNLLSLGNVSKVTAVYEKLEEGLQNSLYDLTLKDLIEEKEEVDKITLGNGNTEDKAVG
jgi:DNA-binding IscR family transcriptional regulator